MSPTDLIVVIPGIMGSALEKDGKRFWSSSLGALTDSILHLNRTVDYLRVPDGLGDAHPDDGVVPTGLMGSIHVVPGLWSPAQGYETLVNRLRQIGFQDAPPPPSTPNLVLFAYDWRLSIRFNAARLKVAVEDALSRWREAAPQNRHAQITFVCHSMGGLIARWYIAVEGGAEVTNKLITFGTPYRGSLKAVLTLAGGPVPVLRKAGVNLHSAVLTLPSVHQLLPSYACVERDGKLHHMDEQEIPGVPTTVVNDAMDFYHRLETAELHIENHPMRHAIVGTTQPTATSLTITQGKLTVHNTLNGDDHRGDGTVPAASIPKGLQLDDNTLRRVAEKHGSLQTNRAVLDEMEGILTAKPVTFKAASDIEISVTAPEIVTSAEDVVIEVSCVRTPQSIMIEVKNERGIVLSRFNSVVRESPQAVTVRALPPGGHVIQVRAGQNGQQAGVSSPLLVWPDE